MKRVYKIILMSFVCTSVMPSMFRHVRRGVQQKPPAGIQTPRIKQVKRPQRPQASKMAALREQVARFLRAQYARVSSLWKKEPVLVEQKKLSVPIVQQIKQPVSEVKESAVVTAEKPLSVAVNAPQVGKSAEAQIESEDILAKLQGENPWNYTKNVGRNIEIALKSPLAQQIKDFLEKNSVDDIESVFSYLISKSEGSVLLEKMCNNYNELAPKIFPLVEKNAGKIDVYLIGSVLLLTPPEQLVQAEKLIERFFDKTNSYHLGLYYTPEEISKLLPNDTKRCLNVLVNIYDKWLNPSRQLTSGFADNPGWKKRYDELGAFLKNTAAEKIARATEDELKTVISMNNEPLWGRNFYILKELLPNNSKFNDAVVNYVINDKRLWKIGMGFDIVKQYARDNPKFKDVIIDYVKTERDPYVQSLVYAVLVEIFKGSDFLNAVFGIDSSYAQTPSYLHLEKYYQDLNNLGHDLEKYYQGLKNWGHAEVIFSPVFTNMIQGIIRKEKELIDAGYDVYYHETQWNNNLLSDIYMMLRAYKSGKELKDFRFLHFDDPVLGKVSERFFESEEKTRKRLLAEGSPVPAGKKLKDFLGIGRSTLFLAKYLFGNLTGPGASPIALMLDNKNWGKVSIPIKEIFSMFGYSDVYQKYENELLALQKKHQGLSPCGELVQIAIPKSNIGERVYCTGFYGEKKEFEIPGIGKTTDMNIISDYVNKNPQEYLEFIRIMTRDKLGGSNPDSGDKMYSYNLVEPATMAEFKEEDEKPLLDRILEDCRQQDEQEKKKAIEWEKAQLASE